MNTGIIYFNDKPMGVGKIPELHITSNVEDEKEPVAYFHPDGYSILYESRYIADCILEDMKDIAQKYGFVSVSDLKDLSCALTGKETVVTNTDNKIGWTLDILCTKAHVVRMRNGYTLELPKPMSIE